MLNKDSRGGLRSLGSQLPVAYETSNANLIDEFVVPALSVSKAYDRASGYFRSSVYHLIGVAMSEFALNGGKLRLICSPSLTTRDWKIIEENHPPERQEIDRAIEKNIEDALSDPASKDCTVFLATLLQHQILDLRLCYKPKEPGIFHTKLGVFSDGTDRISFTGSNNETYLGWLENEERFHVFPSWRSEDHCDADTDYFDRLWKSEIKGFETVPINKATCDLLEKHALPDLKEAQERVMLEFRGQKKREPRGQTDVLELMDHQQRALDDWLQKGKVGIVKHATGSGKTITAIEGIKEYAKSDNPTLVLVPSKGLQKQWSQELSKFMPDATPTLVGGGNSGWRKAGLLEALTGPATTTSPRVIIATMATARGPKFMERLSHGGRMLVVADEVHWIGADKNQLITSIAADAKLGLSATPERYRDEAGTKKIFDYFGDILEPEFNLKEAIERGRLVEYEYHTRTLELSSSEALKWKQLTTRIGRTLGAEGLNESDSFETVKNLVLARAKIAKKAAAKVSVASNILEKEYKPDQRWFVYCEDLEQLTELKEALSDLSLKPMVYHSNRKEEENEAALAWLETEGGILLSMRCLDEGIDVPSVSHALILASSQNPREFIQRRGRILRKPKNGDLKIACVWDLVVIPPANLEEPQKLKRLAAAELARSILFAEDAINLGGVEQLKSQLARLGFKPNDLSVEGTDWQEEETEDD